MKQVFVLDEKDVQLANRLKEKLLASPKDSGILFVGVRAIPASLLSPLPVFEIAIGCSKYPHALIDYAKYILKEDVEKEEQLHVVAFEGSLK